MTTARKHDDNGKLKLIAKMAERFGVDSEAFFNTLKATAFKQRDGSAPSNEQMMALLVVADQYGLNPFTREIYAFPDKQNGIVPVVGVDGWSRIINTHPDFDGMEFNYSEERITPEGAKTSCHEWVECVMYRRDRTRPVIVREYLDEVYRAPFKGNHGPIHGPWQTHPKRFLRHKATIQCARLAFGFVGIFDQDEADRIIESRREREAARGSSVVIQGEFSQQPARAPAAEPLQIEYFPADEFAKSIGKWRAAIEAGKRTAEQVMVMAQAKGELTEEQKAQIRGEVPAVDSDSSEEE